MFANQQGYSWAMASTGLARDAAPVGWSSATTMIVASAIGVAIMVALNAWFILGRKPVPVST